jgi:conjugal transfer pilus assembly protein TrbC
MITTKRLALCLAMGLLIGPASGQTLNSATGTALPTVDALTREMQRIDGERRTLFDVDNQATRSTGPSFPNITPPQTGANGVDLAALVKRFEGGAPTAQHDALLIFVSFTMPTASLQALLASAAKVGATVVLRGFKNNSLKETSATLKALGTPNSAVQIHPQAFTQYRIQNVPAIVLLKGDGSGTLDTQGCALPEDFIAFAGDVSLDYALDTIAQRAPAYTALASRYRRQLRGRE